MTVDIHTHFIPPEFLIDAREGRALDQISLRRQDETDWLVHPQGYRYPLAPAFWDVEAKLRHMDRLGINVSVLSLTPTLFFYWIEGDAAEDFCRLANDSVARLAAHSDGRLYGMAVVPMQRPEAAVAELRRAVTELHLRGVMIGTTIGDVPLDDERFTPFFTAAEELGTPVMLHPYYVGLGAPKPGEGGPRPRLGDFYMVNLTGNPMETCFAATRLILSGFFDRHPALEIVLVHAGGLLPYQVGRLDHGFRVRPETSARIAMPPSTYLRRFSYDTITHASLPLKFLIDLAGFDRVMLGTDIPFDMADERFATYLEEVDLEAPILEAVTGGNAVSLYRLDEEIRRPGPFGPGTA